MYEHGKYPYRGVEKIEDGKYVGYLVRVRTVFSFFVIQFASLKTKNEHYIRFFYVL